MKQRQNARAGDAREYPPTGTRPTCENPGSTQGRGALVITGPKFICNKPSRDYPLGYNESHGEEGVRPDFRTRVFSGISLPPLHSDAHFTLIGSQGRSRIEHLLALVTDFAPPTSSERERQNDLQKHQLQVAGRREDESRGTPSQLPYHQRPNVSFPGKKWLNIGKFRVLNNLQARLSVLYVFDPHIYVHWLLPECVCSQFYLKPSGDQEFGASFLAAVSPLASHQGKPGSIPCPVTRFFACGNRARRCRWLAGFLGDLPFPPPIHSDLPQSPLSALKDLAVKSRPNHFTDSQTSSFTREILYGCPEEWRVSCVRRWCVTYAVVARAVGRALSITLARVTKSAAPTRRRAEVEDFGARLGLRYVDHPSTTGLTTRTGWCWVSLSRPRPLPKAQVRKFDRNRTPKRTTPPEQEGSDELATGREHTKHTTCNLTKRGTLKQRQTQKRTSTIKISFRKPLFHTVYDASWRTVAQLSPSTVTPDNQCIVDIGMSVHTTVDSSLHVIEFTNVSDCTPIQIPARSRDRALDVRLSASDVGFSCRYTGPLKRRPHKFTNPSTDFLCVIFRLQTFDYQPRQTGSLKHVFKWLRKVGLLASHQGEPVSLPGWVTPGFSHVGIESDDSAGRRVLSGISHFPRTCIPALLHTHLYAAIHVKNELFENEKILQIHTRRNCSQICYMSVYVHYPSKHRAFTHFGFSTVCIHDRREYISSKPVFIFYGVEVEQLNNGGAHVSRRSPSHDMIDVKHVYTEVDSAIGSQFIRHVLDDSEPTTDLQGNK
ncbi:hypothetical protein PR048_029596 [Dryococelus australis]|uniref:Uncharacterized protein n=1 Tax=Dryococelus australis TaxID=614101 RepID=A0ABQ9GE53_9NEOP|nr:hypothetical protein PR048_029596 [Dryococelus australis]